MAANVDHDYQNIPGSLFDYFKTSENENEDIEKIELRRLRARFLLNSGFVFVRSSKKRLLGSKWQKTYLALFGPYMIYFRDNRPESKPKEWMSLRQFQSILQDDTVSRRRQFVLRIFSSSSDINELHISTETHEEMHTWLTYIEASIDFANWKYIKQSCSEKILSWKQARCRQDEEYDVVRPRDNYVRPRDNYERSPTDEELTKLASGFGQDWQSFVRGRLGIRQHDIDRFKYNNPNNMKEQVFQAFLFWKKNNSGNATVTCLLLKLNNSPEYIDHDNWSFLDPERRYDPYEIPGREDSPTTVYYSKNISGRSRGHSESRVYERSDNSDIESRVEFLKRESISELTKRFKQNR